MDESLEIHFQGLESTYGSGYLAGTRAIKNSDILCIPSRSVVDGSLIAAWDALRLLIPPTFWCSPCGMASRDFY